MGGRRLDRLEAFDSGFINEAGRTAKFDGVTEEIVSAELHLYNPGLIPDGADGYASPDPTEEYVLGGTLTDPAGMTMLVADLTMLWDLFEPDDKAYAEGLY